jgi:hypothetical protein
MISPHQKIDDTAEVSALNTQTANSSDLSKQSVHDLVGQFESIGQQAKIFKGRILIELKKRADLERVDFEEYIKTQCSENSTLCAMSHQQRNRLMDLAKFFDEQHPMDGITVTCGYEIAAPKNKTVAEAVYQKAFAQYLSVDDIRKLIKAEKLALANKSEVPKIIYSKHVKMTEEATLLIEYLNAMKPGSTDQDNLIVFKTCYEKMKEQINATQHEKASN